MGIHYDYKSTRGAKAMEKQAKREKKLAEKKFLCKITMVPPSRIELETHPYHGCVIPFNYEGIF